LIFFKSGNISFYFASIKKIFFPYDFYLKGKFTL
jgi:hypothetical protein